MKMKCCEHCGCKKFRVMSSYASNAIHEFEFDNTEKIIDDNLTDVLASVNRGVFGYCSQCGKELFNLADEEETRGLLISDDDVDNNESFLKIVSEGLTFGEAIEALKHNCLVNRCYYDDSYLFLSESTAPDYIEKYQHITMINFTGDIFDWTPEQDDMLANDWRIVEVNKEQQVIVSIK